MTNIKTIGELEATLFELWEKTKLSNQELERNNCYSKAQAFRFSLENVITDRTDEEGD